MRKIYILFITAIFFISCASSPLNRRQIVIYSQAEMAAQGERSYRQMQQEVPISTNVSENNYVQCVADYVINVLDPSIQSRNQWEVTVFSENQANAFALPGGKIGVYAGLLDVAINQHQLAAVLAHERHVEVVLPIRRAPPQFWDRFPCYCPRQRRLALLRLGPRPRDLGRAEGSAERAVVWRGTAGQLSSLAVEQFGG